MVQHFVRVILVVDVVPPWFWIWSGEAVGSAARQAFSSATHGLWDIATTFGLAMTGIIAARALRLLAPTLIGLLVLSVAQLVVGVGLRAGFAKVELRQLANAIRLGGLMIAIHLALALFFCVDCLAFLAGSDRCSVHQFCPECVTEMSLFALSLNKSPIIIATHHVFRIAVTIVIFSFIPRFLTSNKRP